jgi:predicted DNA-binding WGR domain protein
MDAIDTMPAAARTAHDKLVAEKPRKSYHPAGKASNRCAASTYGSTR